MKTLAALFIGMGIGYMNQGILYFIFPMGVGLLMFSLDIYYEYKQKEDKI